MSPAFLEFITPKPNPEFYGVTPRPYWVAYELKGKDRNYCDGPGHWHIPNGPSGQHLWPGFAFEWPSDAFKSYLSARYKIPRVEPLINGPIYYGGAPLEDLDWDAFPVMEITDLAYEFHDLVMFDKMLA